MEQRVPTIFELAEPSAPRRKAAGKEAHARPDEGARKLKDTRKASGRTVRRPKTARAAGKNDKTRARK